MKNLRRIGPKMLFSLLVTFVVVLGTFLILAIIQTTSLADEMARDLSRNTAENYAHQMSALFDKTENMVSGLKLAAERFEEIPAQNRRLYLDNMLNKTIADENPGIVGAWACFEPEKLDYLDEQYVKTVSSDESGRFISYFYPSDTGVKRDVLVDYDVPGAGDYYLVPLATGELYVSPPRTVSINEEDVRIISLAYPVGDRIGRPVGVIGVNYALDSFDTLSDTVKLYNTGYGKLLTDQGIAIAHIDDSLIDKTDWDFTESTEAGTISAALQAGDIYVGKSFSPVLNTESYKGFANVPLGDSGINWIYAVVVPESEVMSTTNRMIFSITLVGVIGLVIAAGIIIMISNSIARPIRSMCNVANKIAVGDLTTAIPGKYLTYQDEIGDLSRDIKQMQDNLVSTLSGIDVAVDSLHAQVVDGTQALDVLNDRLFAISVATEELCAGMETTSTSTVKMTSTTADIENAVEMVAEKSGEGAGKSAEIHVRAAELGQNVTGAIDTSNRIFHEIKQALEKALSDSKAVEEINALADAILGITSQTTLLALNASIEAARAGEVGRGFAVVAKEISTLADNSKNTVNQIQAITKVVMSAVNALAGSSTDLLNFVAGNVQKDYQDMLTAADSYTHDAVYISDMTSDLSATSQKLMSSIQIMLKGINDVSLSAQEGATATASLAEQTGGIAGNAASVVENMNQTQKTSEELADLVNQFKL